MPRGSILGWSSKARGGGEGICTAGTSRIANTELLPQPCVFYRTPLPAMALFLAGCPEHFPPSPQTIPLNITPTPSPPFPLTHLFLISPAMVMKACSTLVAALAEVSM